MSGNKNTNYADAGEAILGKAKNFWDKNNKVIMGVCAAIILIAGGWLGYKYFIKAPKERKAAEAMYKAEEYFRSDSVNLALNGDGQFAGFSKIISSYGGTQAGNLARLYAGLGYIQQNQNQKAVDVLKSFSTNSKPIQARAYKLLGDAYGDLGKSSDALNNYKKAAHHFEEDKTFSADALFHAAYFADKVMKDTKEAKALYVELKQKYPQTNHGMDADKYLAQLGVYNEK